MAYGGIVWTVLLILFLVLITCVIISWVTISHESFTNIELKPGMKYTIQDREYIFPQLEMEGKCLLLKEEVIENLRTIVQRMHDLFQDLKIDYHLTGGTLLGVVRHGSIPMPQDDDVDVAVQFKHRDFLFSSAFGDHARKFGLKPKFLAGTSLSHADRHGAALRLQLLEMSRDQSETCDVFFLEEEDGVVYKIDGWFNDKLVKNVKEQFLWEDVYPLQVTNVDGLDVWIPKNPKNLLTQQYGQDVFTHAKIRPRLISHAFPMRFLRLLWVSSV